MFQCLQLFSVGWIKKKVVNQGEITCRKQYIFTKLKRGSHEIVPSHVPINLSKIPQSSPISLHYLPTKVKQTWCRKAINGMGCCDLWMAREMLPASFRVGHRPLAASLSLSLPLVRDRAKQQVLPRRASNYFSKSAKLNSRTNLHFLLKRQFL